MPSLYDVSVPVFARALRNLDHLLVKAADSGQDEAKILDARLAPDMLPFMRQVQIACDTAKLAVTRLAQSEPMPMAYEEASFSDLRERISKTLAYIEGTDPAAFDGREVAEIVLDLPNMKRTFTGLGMLTQFSLPNFFFHVATAYGLLRANGVELRKADYLQGADAPLPKPVEGAGA